jgi:predicted kinase
MLRQWTEATFKEIEECLNARREQGYVRECHGDLHSGNIVLWQNKLIPFDGIEFNPSFRWIDLLSDLAFLTMDLKKHGRSDFAALLLDVYLAKAGDFESLQILPWYELYRAMVRAKVAALRLGQCHDEEAAKEVRNELTDWLSFATEITKSPQLSLAITHGLSASGKSTGALKWVKENAAIRLRSDVERKRILGRPMTYRPTEDETSEVYSSAMTKRVYERLLRLARAILQAGFPVVVDATFLKREQRRVFEDLADSLKVDFCILEFQASPDCLRERIRKRAQQGGDPSDADLETLENQMRSAEPLKSSERSFIRSPG